MLYSIAPVKHFVKNTGIEIIQKIYSTKIITGFGWLIVVIALPYWDKGVPLFIWFSAGLLFITLIFLRQLIIDLVAFQGDLILGRDTFPTWLGLGRVSLIAYAMTVASSIVSIIACLYYGRACFFAIMVPLVVYLYLLKRIAKTDYLISLRYEFIIDANYACLLLCIIL